LFVWFKAALNSPCAALNAAKAKTSAAARPTKTHQGCVTSRQPKANTVHARYDERNAHDERKKAAWPCAEVRRKP